MICSIIVMCFIFSTAKSISDIQFIQNSSIPNYPKINISIVGMKSAKNKEYPWFALYQCDNAIFGGALIDSNIILTTAHSAKHCDNLGIKPLELILGENEANILEGSERLFRIENISYKSEDPNVDDIALLKLDRMVNNDGCDQHIGQAELPKQNQTIPFGHNCKLVGWGKRYNEKFLLQKASFQFMDYPLLKHYIQDIPTVETNQKGAFNCSNYQHLSSVMYCLVDSHWMIVGIGYNSECRGSYTQTSYYIDWINKAKKQI